MRFLLFFMLMIPCSLLQSQTIYFNIDQASQEKIDAYNRANRAEKEVRVYRIQYAVVSDRMAMEQELRKFQSNFAQTTDWHQKGPYFYMKAGAYLSKMEAFTDMSAIRRSYPGAIFIVEPVKKRMLL